MHLFFRSALSQTTVYPQNYCVSAELQCILGTVECIPRTTGFLRTTIQYSVSPEPQHAFRITMYAQNYKILQCPLELHVPAELLWQGTVTKKMGPGQFYPYKMLLNFSLFGSFLSLVKLGFLKLAKNSQFVCYIQYDLFDEKMFQLSYGPFLTF